MTNGHIPQVQRGEARQACALKPCLIKIRSVAGIKRRKARQATARLPSLHEGCAIAGI